MDPETQTKIEETVVEILKSSNMEEMTEFKVRNMASEKLDIDLSLPQYKKFVRGVVESFLLSRKDETPNEEEAQEEEEEQEEEDDDSKKKGDREYDDDGDLIICRLTKKRRVTIQEFRGKTLVSIREFYQKDGKELPSSKGISLTTDQWAAFKKSVPAIEAAIKKLESRLN
ncbi:RNA polymerase II transcriptional coactivator KELP [Cinnamomum micranthum f. kanehirae]|uniref:RNA polymerase II transcriptional coactivator KELP n=1 Tax=Cinnamomum micranthum f. kanehirae TaxID=337451 RepID=A0A3S3PLG5_9MAGN|nr:RNA polymerase II transcriptional coactivator KELP [Cinnamomum micranthum f. kanehirae]